MTDTATNPSSAPAPTVDAGKTAIASEARAQVSRICWLHFANDLTLDFLTPLLVVTVSAAWIGAMEGAADGVGQVLKLFTGRASDRTGKRAAWVRAGYTVNAIARPLAGIGMLLGLPAWVIACRIGDRVGKGVRGSATDALLTDWSEPENRAHDFARTRVMDHLGATLGALAAAAAAFVLSPDQIWKAIVALVLVTVMVVQLTRRLRDRVDVDPAAQVETKTVPTAWWPRDPALRLPLSAIGIATFATKISPLMILVFIAGAVGDPGHAAWPLWMTCLGWAGLGLVQMAAASFAGVVADRLGPAAMLRLGWVLGAAIFVGLALAHGPSLIAWGVAFGVCVGLTEGAEKSWVAALAPKPERALAFGALAIVSALTALAGNAACGLLLAHWGAQIFLGFAVIAVLGAAATLRPGPAWPAAT